MTQVVIDERTACWIWRGASSRLDETRRFLFEDTFDGKIPQNTPAARYELRRAITCHRKCVSPKHSELWIGIPTQGA